MLREGFHKSFSELFALVKQQNERRLAAGPESALWSMVLLEDEREKMETLQLYLTQAETALRKGSHISKIYGVVSNSSANLIEHGLTHIALYEPVTNCMQFMANFLL